MHKRAVFNFLEFKSRKCSISFSRDYTSQGQKNKKALKITTFRGSCIVVFRCLDASLTLGSAHSLLYAVNRCEKDTQSFSLRLQVIRPTIRAARRHGGRAFVPKAVRLKSHPTKSATKKKTNPIGLVFFLVAEGGFEPPDLRVMRGQS